jgi:hypothetical protein
MYFKIIPLVMLISLVGCSTTKRGEGEFDQIRTQKLSTTFKQDTIRIETDCAWFTFDKSKCDITSIEAVGTASANGNTESNRRTALIRAGDRARANVRHFIQEDVSSTRVTNTLAKNVEKASDRMKSRTTTGEVVAMSDSDAEKDTNHSVRENSNDTAYQLNENIRVNAQGILRGFKVVKQEVVGAQEVSVTIRWDKESEIVSNQLRKKFGN